MLHMIEAYEKSRALLAGRTHEINQALRNPDLRTKEREKLILRRDMIAVERNELLHRIREMQAILEVKPIEGTHQYGKGRQGPGTDPGAVRPAVNKPSAPEDHTSGAA